MIVYDIFRHNSQNVRVIDRDGRHGTIIEIRETGPDWIEPIILWDGEKEPQRHSAFGLVLESKPDL